MPTLGVCGDSYFAATINDDLRSDLKDSHGKHFSEIMAAKLGYDLFTLARGACSNSSIRLQIDEMIKRKVDFVIVGVTSPDRLEYRTGESKYDFRNGINNIVYDGYPDQSSDNINSTGVLFSDTISNILAGYGPVKDKDQFNAIREYFDQIHDTEFRHHQDSWIIANGIQELKDAKIPYILLGHAWLCYTNYFKFYSNNDRFLLRRSDKDIFDHNKYIPFHYDTFDEDTGHHTTRRWHVSDRNQIRIANNLLDYINSKNLLVWRSYEF